MTKRRLGVLMLAALLVLFCLAVYVTSLSLARHTPHDCTGDACPICLAVSVREELARLLVLLATALLFAALLHCKRTAIPVEAYRTAHRTPVSLKVKLSN